MLITLSVRSGGLSPASKHAGRHFELVDATREPKPFLSIIRKQEFQRTMLRCISPAMFKPSLEPTWMLIDKSCQ